MIEFLEHIRKHSEGQATAVAVIKEALSDLKEMEDFYGLRPSMFEELHVKEVLAMRQENLSEIALHIQAIRNKMNVFYGDKMMYAEMTFEGVARVNVYQDYTGVVRGYSEDSLSTPQSTPLQYTD
tara:strand:+ start:26921 stop:27295 length:375 start_codon:yes stop_codon:yes gene_type:complete